jgi:hypothetical protein
LKQDGVFVFFHHIENRNYKYEEWKNTFKIKTNKRSYNEIEKKLDYNFFKFKTYDVVEDGFLIWKYYIFSK